MGWAANLNNIHSINLWQCVGGVLLARLYLGAFLTGWQAVPFLCTGSGRQIYHSPKTRGERALVARQNFLLFDGLLNVSVIKILIERVAPLPFVAFQICLIRQAFSRLRNMLLARQEKMIDYLSGQRTQRWSRKD